MKSTPPPSLFTLSTLFSLFSALTRFTLFGLLTQPALLTPFTVHSVRCPCSLFIVHGSLFACVNAQAHPRQTDVAD
eukprot:11177153-Lingulodinium_polyedra.AAC.1